jgi:hypothetical protein
LLQPQPLFRNSPGYKLEELYAELEIRRRAIVDDPRVDDTFDVVREYRSPRVTLLNFSACWGGVSTTDSAVMPSIDMYDNRDSAELHRFTATIDIIFFDLLILACQVV